MEGFDNMENAQEQMNKYDLIMIYFTATWCGPCKRIAPFIAELLLKIPSCKFFKVDVDDEKLEELVSKFNINSMPTFCFIKDQELINTITGADKDKLLNYFQNDLNITLENNTNIIDNSYIDNLNTNIDNSYIDNLNSNIDNLDTNLDDQFGSLK
jgi:thioredoxin 1